MKIKNRIRKWSHKGDGIGVRRIRRFPFLPTPLTTPSLTFRLWSSENQIVGVGSRGGRTTKPIAKSGNVHCDWFILPLLLPTPTIRFSLDHKRNVSDGVVSGVRTLFSLTLVISSTLLITTPTPSLVKTTLKGHVLGTFYIFNFLFIFRTASLKVWKAWCHKRMVGSIKIFYPEINKKFSPAPNIPPM